MLSYPFLNRNRLLISHFLSLYLMQLFFNNSFIKTLPYFAEIIWCVIFFQIQPILCQVNQTMTHLLQINLQTLPFFTCRWKIYLDYKDIQLLIKQNIESINFKTVWILCDSIWACLERSNNVLFYLQFYLMPRFFTTRLINMFP
jgi:hypothetical protein